MPPDSRGLFMAVVGPDGAGKSTLIRQLLRELECRHPVRRFHWKPGLPHIQHRQPRSPHRHAPRAMLPALAFLIYHTLGFVLGHRRWVAPWCRNGGMVIMDRYYLDLLVDPRRYRMTLPRFWLALGNQLVPQPDLILYLDTSPVALVQRKEELSLVEARRQCRAFKKHMAELPNGVVLDNNTAPGHTVRQALGHIREWAS